MRSDHEVTVLANEMFDAIRHIQRHVLQADFAAARVCVEEARALHQLLWHAVRRVDDGKAGEMLVNVFRTRIDSMEALISDAEGQ